MAARNDDEAAESLVGVAADEHERYADIILESGAVVVYDVDDESAWLQSSSAVALDAMT